MEFKFAGEWAYNRYYKREFNLFPRNSVTDAF
jgi:hypothetical protein